jgi:DNA-binding FadR family transcriptional regulator
MTADDDDTTASEDALGFRRAPRPRAADDVFDQLAAAILRGSLRTGDRLPAEKELADRFGLSRIIVRQAVHRLADAGLVRARQGGATEVCDYRLAGDLALFELEFRLGPGSAADVRAFTEWELTMAHAMLWAAQRRGKPAEFTELGELVEAYVAAGAADADVSAFEERFWRRVANISRNRLYELECNWWFRTRALQPLTMHPVKGTPAERSGAYREIVRRLFAGEDAATYFLTEMAVAQGVTDDKPRKHTRPKRGGQKGR